MKRLTIALLLVLALSLMTFATVLADTGGMPDAHGADGKDFGAAVSGLAQTDPGALADHVSGCFSGEMSASEGVPALHGVDGRTFGGLVSALAQADPAALAAHVGGAH